MEFEIDHIVYPVEVIRKHNKNTYIRVKSGKVISVTTNKLVTEKRIMQMLNDNVEVIKKMMIKCQKEDEKKEKFYILGVNYDIIVVSDMKNIEFFDNKILTPSKRKLELWYQKEMRRIYEKRLWYWYDRFEEKLPEPKLKIRNMKTRWGVCNIKDNSITLNSRLMEYDVSKLDYVVIHELSHFRYFNHSKDFWNLVSKYCPNYKQVRKSLKEE